MELILILLMLVSLFLSSIAMVLLFNYLDKTKGDENEKDNSIYSID